MAQKAGIYNERRGHRGRKTIMIQTLSENDTPPTHIAHIVDTYHKFIT